MTTLREAAQQALKALEMHSQHYESDDTFSSCPASESAWEGHKGECDCGADEANAAIAALRAALEQPEPAGWISVKDALPKAVRRLSYGQSVTDVVLVRHSDRPDYPITAHAVIGDGLGAGIAIPTGGASEHPEIAWYSASSNLRNPFSLKNEDYERYMPKVFGSKITHWKPITPPPAQHPDPDYRAMYIKVRDGLAALQQRKPLTDAKIEELMDLYDVTAIDFVRAIEAAHGIEDAK